MPTNIDQARQLVDAQKLLETLFDADTRPTDRWLRKMTRRKVVPYYRIGGLLRFDVEEVRAALERDCRVVSKASRKTVSPRA